jgi:hypothetical protein
MRTVRRERAWAMRRRRLLLTMLVAGALMTALSFAVPVTAEPFGSCGPAGLWFPYLGDPSGAGEPPESYAEYNACGRAAAPWHVALVAGLLLATACLSALLTGTARGQDSSA